MKSALNNMIARFIRDESGQALVERAVIAAMFTLGILASTKYVVDGMVSFYAYVTAMVCLPIP